MQLSWNLGKDLRPLVLGSWMKHVVKIIRYSKNVTKEELPKKN